MILADTTFLIDLVDGDKGAVEIAKKLEDETVYISVVSLYEYLFGIYYKFSDDKNLLQKKLLAAENAFNAFKVLPLTKKIAYKSAIVHAILIKQGNEIGINDVYIGATALNYDCKVVTRNKKHLSLIKNLKIEEY